MLNKKDNIRIKTQWKLVIKLKLFVLVISIHKQI